jgi:predicted dehydrogenase
MTQPPEKTRVAVVGCGYLGRFHAQKYAGMADVDLVGVVDVELQQAQAVAQTCGCRSFTDYRHLLGEVDAVSVVTPTVSHFAIAQDLLAHNVHLLIEKPITTTLAEADRLIELARDRRCIVQVGHLERFNPAFLAIEAEAETPLLIEAQRLSVFKDRATDVSVVLDLMIHDIDIILSLAGSEIDHIEACGACLITDHLDVANARFHFENGCVANVTASRVSLTDSRRLRLFQSAKSIEVDFGQRRIEFLPLMPPQGSDRALLGEIRRRSFEQSDALLAELTAFVHSVHRQEPPKVPASEGRRALAVALDVMERAAAAESLLVCANSSC